MRRASGSSPIILVPALVAAATALVWWSELPSPEPAEPAVFD
ncbi:MAG TPA: hypothetical protein VEC11_16650 [Allosphingosinicella sp.]|nr:hypothetical protein [Allosphingosinicella sp.]